MTDLHEDLGEVLAANRNRNPADIGTYRISYDVGLLMRGRFNTVIAYGRSLGLDVEVHPGGGILSQRGYIRAHGPWGEAREFLVELQELFTS